MGGARHAGAARDHRVGRSAGSGRSLLGLALGALLPPKAPALLVEVTTTLVAVNVMLIGFNLLPIPALDGWQAWRVFAPSNLRGLGTTIRRAFLRKRARELEEEMAELVRKRNRN